MSLHSSYSPTHQPSLVSTTPPHQSIGQNITHGEYGLEKQEKMGQSNYQIFLEGSKKQTQYPLPDTFKLIQITDCTQKEIKEEYEWFNFSILSYSCRQLCEVAVKLIKSCDFQRYCSNSQIERLVHAICLGYNQVSYHNFSHAFSLMHMFYQLTKLDPKFKKMCTNQQLGYILIAALAHDINHPGTNNTYEIKIKSPLAIQTKNEAVLEKMHIQQFFALLKTNQLNIFDKSESPEEMKKLIINSILATDVVQHFKNLQKLKVILSKDSTHQMDSQQRKFCLEQVFHACDIGNPCLKFQQYINWASLLSYEFNTQTLLEQKKQVEVTQMLKFKNLTNFYQGQIGFINYLVYPLWKELACKWTGFQFLIGNIETNLKLLEFKRQNQKHQ